MTGLREKGGGKGGRGGGKGGRGGKGDGGGGAGAAANSLAPKQLNERFGNAVTPFSQPSPAAKGKGKGFKGGDSRDQGGRSHAGGSGGRAESKPSDAGYKRLTPAQAIAARIERDAREAREAGQAA